MIQCMSLKTLARKSVFLTNFDVRTVKFPAKSMTLDRDNNKYDLTSKNVLQDCIQWMEEV